MGKYYREYDFDRFSRSCSVKEVCRLTRGRLNQSPLYTISHIKQTSTSAVVLPALFKNGKKCFDLAGSYRVDNQ